MLLQALPILCLTIGMCFAVILHVEALTLRIGIQHAYLDHGRPPSGDFLEAPKPPPVKLRWPISPIYAIDSNLSRDNFKAGSESKFRAIRSVENYTYN
jgi:hypothetical protein